MSTNSRDMQIAQAVKLEMLNVWNMAEDTSCAEFEAMDNVNLPAIIASVPDSSDEVVEVEPVVSNETVNVKLLEVAKRARKFAFSYAPHGGLLSELDEAIAAAEQQAQPELTDDEIETIADQCMTLDASADDYFLDHSSFARAVIAAHEAKRGRISSEIPSKGGV